MVIAIVGSGPAGFYCADFLTRALPDAQVHVFERLPQPYGLLRYGVASDHAGTRGLSRLFDRIARRANLRCFANVGVGADIAFEDLRVAYDAVILATGAACGAKAISSDPDLPSSSSITAFDLLRCFNGHPDADARQLPGRTQAACIIGHGNVALDAARLLAHPSETLARCGVPRAVVEWHAGLGLQEIHLCGRGHAGNTRFSAAGLEELENVDGLRRLVDPADVSMAEGSNLPALEVLRRWAGHGGGGDSGHGMAIRWHFECAPLRHRDRVLVVRDPSRGIREIAADVLIHAVGQRPAVMPGVPVDPQTGAVAHRNGRVEGMPGTYVVGWAAGGRNESIAGSRAAAGALAEVVIADLRQRSVLLDGRAAERLILGCGLGSPDREPPAENG